MARSYTDYITFAIGYCLCTSMGDPFPSVQWPLRMSKEFQPGRLSFPDVCVIT